MPSAALSVLELAASTNGIPAVGFFAQVPHYVNATYPAASIALLTAVGRHLGVEPPIGQLATRALERRNLLDAATASDEDTRAHVERLDLTDHLLHRPEAELRHQFAHLLGDEFEEVDDELGLAAEALA